MPPLNDVFGKRTFKWVAGSAKFADEVTKLYEDRAAEVVKRAVLDMTDDIIDNSAFRTGRLRVHWKLGLNGMPGSYDPTASDKGRKYSADPTPIEKFKLSDRIYIYNKAPYAAVIEAIGSKTTAAGQMIAQQRLGWSGYIDRAGRDLGAAK